MLMAGNAACVVVVQVLSEVFLAGRPSFVAEIEVQLVVWCIFRRLEAFPSGF